MKYLILSFKNGKIFRRKDQTGLFFDEKDYQYDMHGYRKRVDRRHNFYSKMYKEEITVHQVSNVLHVLFNQRPVPSLRPVLFQRNEYYFEKALYSYVKIDTPKIFNYRTKDYEYPVEIIKTNKSREDSWRTNVHINWEIIKLYFKDDFQWFVDYVNLLLRLDCTQLTFDEVKMKLRQLDKNNLSDFEDELKKRFYSAFLAYLDKDKYAYQITQIKRVGIVNLNGISYITKLSGRIIVHVTDGDIDMLEKYSTGFATILDGGLVAIESLEDDISKEYLDGFRQLKDISTDLITGYESKNKI